jgi:hypothetical protein
MTLVVYSIVRNILMILDWKLCAKDEALAMNGSLNFQIVYFSTWPNVAGLRVANLLKRHIEVVFQKRESQFSFIKPEFKSKQTLQCSISESEMRGQESRNNQTSLELGPLAWKIPLPKHALEHCRRNVVVSRWCNCFDIRDLPFQSWRVLIGRTVHWNCLISTCSQTLLLQAVASVKKVTSLR